MINLRKLFNKKQQKNIPEKQIITTERPETRVRLLNLKKNLKPERKNPDFTNFLVNQALAQITGRNSVYDLDNLLDLDQIFHDFHNISPLEKNNLEKFINSESDFFTIYIKDIKLLKPDFYKINLGLDRKSKISSKNESEIYQSLIIYFDDKAKVLEISVFYPTSATIRGYSIGSKILMEIERIARVFKVKEIVVSYPTASAMTFYQKKGFNISKMDQSKVIQLKKLI